MAFHADVTAVKKQLIHSPGSGTESRAREIHFGRMAIWIILSDRYVTRRCLFSVSFVRGRTVFELLTPAVDQFSHTSEHVWRVRYAFQRCSHVAALFMAAQKMYRPRLTVIIIAIFCTKLLTSLLANNCSGFLFPISVPGYSSILTVVIEVDNQNFQHYMNKSH